MNMAHDFQRFSDFVIDYSQSLYIGTIYFSLFERCKVYIVPNPILINGIDVFNVYIIHLMKLLII